MTISQIKAAILSRAKSRRGKNKYTQGAKRTRVAFGWSDCSSFVRWAILMVTGIDIGLNTTKQMQSANMTTVHSGGKYPDVSKLQVGDCIYFSNPQHVEMVIKVGPTLDKCKLIGHGGGKPSIKPDAKDYCDKRYSAGKGYKMTRRPKLAAKTWALGQRVIVKGCFGEDVQQMQQGLIALGYAVGQSGADWDCGDATEAAIRKFQKAYKLDVDGEFGPKSLAKMRALLDAWQPAENTDPLTEDDCPDEDVTPDLPDEDGDAPSDEDGVGDDTPVEQLSPEADGAMGSSQVNPYPQPTGIKRRGSKGAAVKWIQWELRQSGLALGKFGPHKDGIDGDFGSATEKAVRKFQKAHKDSNGKPLVVDGEVGPKTIAALLKDTGDGASLPPASAVDAAGRIYDVSSYDGNIDWDKVAALTGAQRCEMVIIRAQASKLEDKLMRNIVGCKARGIPYGVYAYTYAGTAAQGRADADRFYQNVVAAGGEPVCWVIDAEEGKNTKAVIEAMRVRLRERVGPDAAIWFYSYDSRCRSWASIMGNYDGVWTARWNTPDIAPGYLDYDLWQYGYTNVPGIRKTTDTSKRHPNKSLAQVINRRAK